jgi:hypothetical protein
MADIETNRAMNDDTILLIIYFDSNFPNAKLHPYDDYLHVTSQSTDYRIFVLIA